MRRSKFVLPEINPILVDLVMVLAISFVMSAVLFTAGYMVFVKLAGQ
ncbi:MAG: hypothetical protein JNL40_00850 [Cyclobacteriaceae bacterium]|nr:hypothetical protein [Cyclobacteriaceae bacterium]